MPTFREIRADIRILRRAEQAYRYRRREAIISFSRLEEMCDLHGRSIWNYLDRGSWFECEHCAAWHPGYEEVDAEGWGSICETCRQDHFRWHDGHEVYYHIEDYPQDEDHADGNLYDSEENPLDHLEFMGGNPDRDLFLGVELEVEHNTYDAIDQAANEFKGFAILKEDGSLSNGFEIVTTAATLQVHQSKWPTLLSESLKDMLRGGWGQPHCGLHIHASNGELCIYCTLGEHPLVNGHDGHIRGNVTEARPYQRTQLIENPRYPGGSLEET